MKIPPGAAFGGAPGALRAPGRGYFHRNSGQNASLGSFWGVIFGPFSRKQGGSGGAARPPQDKIILGGVGSPTVSGGGASDDNRNTENGNEGPTGSPSQEGKHTKIMLPS